MGRARSTLNEIPSERRVVTVLRWTARVIGTLILLLIAALAIGEGLHPARLFESLRVTLLTVAMLTMMGGTVVGWKWEGIGGLLILGGFVFFAIVKYGDALNIVFGPWLLAGLLYLECWWMKSKAAG